jgi:serine/threonine-protein kinase
LGHYEIVSLVGAGGMGEVYRARDTKLGRDVAIKVLPEVFTRDHDRMARFAREAHVLASLNHPNIAAIYGVEESGERRALVLELIEGQTLAERMAKGAIPLEDALKIALQIAQALEAAHEKNMVHRDLKPANVKVTPEGLVKVLDFGLAKAMEEQQTDPLVLSQSPTLSLAATGAGIILGTAGYMAPEQARGKRADGRADIWAFGVILFEMLAGVRAFDGETVSDILARILEREPAWDRLPPLTPIEVRRLIQRCLSKNVRDRLQAIGDARTLLQEWNANPAALVVSAPPTVYPLWKKLMPWVTAAALVAAVWVWKPSPPPTESAVARLEFPLPQGQSLAHGYRHGIEISPDGKRMAFVGSPMPGGGTRIYIRSMDQWDATPIPGSEGGSNPFFSPDSEWLGFLIGSQ